MEGRLVRQVLEECSLRPSLNLASIVVQAPEWLESPVPMEKAKREVEKVFRKFSGLKSVKVLQATKRELPSGSAASRMYVNFETEEDGVTWRTA